MAERLIITQDLCRKVQVMLKGTTIKETAKLLGVGESTIGRIKQAGFDVEQYRKITDARKEKKLTTEEQQDQQVPGQLEMDLEEKQPSTFEEAMAQKSAFFGLEERDKRYMRFEAAQVEKILEKLDKINDNLCQLLRRTDG